MLISIRFALLVTLTVLGVTIPQPSKGLSEPAQLNNVAIEPPKQLEASKLLQLQQELEPIAVETKTVAVTLPTTGSHQDWMAAAGISPSDYSYVEFIISHESTWRPTAVNSSSGATGLCQALPASKMSTAGSDYMTSPVTQLKWCDQYAKSRYGGWAKAYSFWQANRWW